MTWKYTYKAHVVRVVDGDTVDLIIDCGLDIHSKQRVRLYGVDAPEIFGINKLSDAYERGEISMNWLKEKILDCDVEVVTHKDRKGKFGRYLATIYKDGININRTMIEEGFAKEYA